MCGGVDGFFFSRVVQMLHLRLSSLRCASANSTSRLDGGAKVFPPAKASVKGDNKRLTSPGSSWSCRTTSTADEEEEVVVVVLEEVAEEEEECRSFSEEQQSSFVGVFFFPPHRLMLRVWGGRRSISDHISGFLRAHFTNGILSMLVPPSSTPDLFLHGGMLMSPQPVRVVFGCFQAAFMTPVDL